MLAANRQNRLHLLFNFLALRLLFQSQYSIVGQLIQNPDTQDHDQQSNCDNDQ